MLLFDFVLVGNRFCAYWKQILCIELDICPFVGDHSSRLELCITFTCFGLSCLWDGVNQYRLEVIVVGRDFLLNR